MDPSHRIAAGSPAYYSLAIMLGSLAAMGPLAIDMYLPAFPTIADELGSTASSLEATSAAYFVGLALGQSIYGPLSDRVGRLRPLYAGLTVFILASIGCAMATSVSQLIVLRIAQALGGCAEMVVARAMVRDYFAPRDSMRVLSLLILVMGLAPILAPLMGGQLLVHFGWRAIFITLASYAGVCLVASRVLLRESLPPEARRSDSAAQILRIYGRLLTDRVFIAQTAFGGLVMAGMFAYISGSPFVFITLFGVPPERFGLFFGTNALGLITASQINGRLAGRLTPEQVVGRVLPFTAAAALVLLVDTVTGAGGFVGILVPLFVCVASVGFVVPNSIVMAMAPRGEIAGSASALLGTIQFALGAAAGGAVSAFNNGTAVPLGAVIAVCGVGAYLAFRVAQASPVPSARTASAS